MRRVGKTHSKLWKVDTDENTAQGNAMNETSVILFELYNHSEKQKHDYF